MTQAIQSTKRAGGVSPISDDLAAWMASTAAQGLYFKAHEAEDGVNLVDSFGSFSSLPTFAINGTTAGIWSDNAGWFTSAGDHSPILSGNATIDAFCNHTSLLGGVFIMSCWILIPTGALTANSGVLGYGASIVSNTVPGYGLRLVSASKKLQVTYGDGVLVGGASNVGTNAVSLDAAAHIAVAFAISSAGVVTNYIFIDGALDDSSEFSTLSPAGAASFGLHCFSGRFDGGSAGNFTEATIQLSDIIFLRIPYDVTSELAAIMRALGNRRAAIGRGIIDALP